MRQRRSRFNRGTRVITVRAPMWMVDMVNSMPPSELNRALRLGLKRLADKGGA